MIERTTEPVIRVRVAHKQTAKGWSLAESTVEVSCPMGDDGDLRAMAPLLKVLAQEAYATGAQEAARRNHEEGRV